MDKLDPRQPDIKGKGQFRPPSRWVFWVWFVLMALITIWFWNAAAHQTATRTIPYSQFKKYLAEGEVVQCTLEKTEIDGQIKPKLAATSNAAKPIMKAPPPSEANESQSPNAAKNEAAKRAATAQTNPVNGPPAGKQKPAEAQPPKPNNPQNKAAAALQPFNFRTVRVDDPDLIQELEKQGVKFTGVTPNSLGTFFWVWLLPIGLIALVWMFLSRRMRGIGQSMMGFGSSRAKLVVEKDVHVGFSDVAGCEEAKYELQEVVMFLKEPSRYQALGARIPKGILLIGPPGTGKTLLARAVAGEAKVPFYSISGSEFVEMFVGVGAARVRDLFQQAKSNAPCIVFIDELDAVGRQRGVRMGMTNDEREQTLNQLLVGLDGFEPNLGVVVLAATNRPEVLDHALLRPGRFDRQVVVDAPDIDGRIEILKLHARGKPLAKNVDLHKIAQETPGFSGADLANLINEAALLAARLHEHQITQRDLEDAVEKVLAGPERKSRRLSKEDKRRVAYHEVGHALVGTFSEHGDKVHKVSIVPRGHTALGYTLQLPESDRYVMSYDELADKIKGMLGGRAAEEMVFGETTTGAENDLEHATALARQMVCVYGMGKSVGLMHCAERTNPFLPLPGETGLRRDCSEQTAREIDEEVKSLLDTLYEQAKQLLQDHRATLDFVAGELLQRETLDAQTFNSLLHQATPVSSA